MSQEGAEKIKGKLKELTALIKEEAAEDSAELREEIKSSINELKKELEEKWSKADEQGKRSFLTDVQEDFNSIIRELEVKDFFSDAKDDLVSLLKQLQTGAFIDNVKDDFNLLLDELDAKALKIKYTFQEKFSNSKHKKDEAVVKTADSLIDAINNVKSALTDYDEKEK